MRPNITHSLYENYAIYFKYRLNLSATCRNLKKKKNKLTGYIYELAGISKTKRGSKSVNCNNLSCK
jgi:hypothetical protein